MVQSLDKKIRNEILISARVIGAGLRQLARLTGVSSEWYKSAVRIKNDQ
jgi:hypothetical protein